MEALVYIDNVLFTGDDKEELIRAAQKFIDRCKKCGAILNDYSLEPVTSFEFLGVAYDLVARTVALTPKTREKLQACKEALHQQTTKRQLAAVFGTIMFTRGVTEYKLARHYHALKFFSGVMSAPTGWDEIVFVPVSMRDAIQAIIRGVENAPPHPLVEDQSPPELEIFIDASAGGWGAYILSPEGWTKELAMPWSRDDHAVWNLYSSVAAEPLAFVRALKAAVSVNHRHVKVYTDHQPLVFAANAVTIRCHAYADALKTIQDIFPQLRVTIEHIAGVDNVVADKLSRQFF